MGNDTGCFIKQLCIKNFILKDNLSLNAWPEYSCSEYLQIMKITISSLKLRASELPNLLLNDPKKIF